MTQNATGTVTHRSYSQINQLRTCGEQYRLERIEHAPSRPSCAAVAGTAVHTGTETVDHLILAGGDYADVRSESIAAALAALDEQVVKYTGRDWPVDTWRKYGRQDIEWFRETGIPNSINAYVDWRISTPQYSLAEVPNFGPAIEVPFNHYLSNGQLIHGWIDRVFTDGNGFYPVDLKSGRKPTTDEQLGLYAAALNEALGWDVVYGFYLYALKTGEAKVAGPIRVNHWTADKIEAVYLQSTALIDAGIFIPHPGEACFHCGVSQSCQFIQAVT